MPIQAPRHQSGGQRHNNTARRAAARLLLRLINRLVRRHVRLRQPVFVTWASVSRPAARLQLDRRHRHCTGAGTFNYSTGHFSSGATAASGPGAGPGTGVGRASAAGVRAGIVGQFGPYGWAQHNTGPRSSGQAYLTATGHASAFPAFAHQAYRAPATAATARAAGRRAPPGVSRAGSAQSGRAGHSSAGRPPRRHGHLGLASRRAGQAGPSLAGGSDTLSPATVRDRFNRPVQQTPRRARHSLGRAGWLINSSNNTPDRAGYRLPSLGRFWTGHLLRSGFVRLATG